MLLGAGAFTDRSSERLGDGLVSSRGHLYGGTLGIELSNRHKLARDEAADSLIFSSTFAPRYAYGDGDIRTLFVDSDAAVDELIESVTGGLTIHEIRLQPRLGALLLGSGPVNPYRVA